MVLLKIAAYNFSQVFKTRRNYNNNERSSLPIYGFSQWQGKVNEKVGARGIFLNKRQPLRLTEISYLMLSNLFLSFCYETRIERNICKNLSIF